jgi:hypothetical protein
VTENAVDHIPFLSATPCDTSAERAFIALHFPDFLHCPNGLRALPFSMIYEIISRRPLRLNSDGLINVINNGIQTNWEMFGLLEFVRLEHLFADVITMFFFPKTSFDRRLKRFEFASKS